MGGVTRPARAGVGRGVPRAARGPQLPRLDARRSVGVVVGGVCALLLAGAVPVAVPRAVSWIKHHPYFLIDAIAIDGNRRLTDEQILDAARIAVGQSLWDLSLDRVRLRLENHPWILRARVHCRLPTRLAIDITERQPIAIVRFEELYYVDRRGRVLSALLAGDSRDLPVITGLEEGIGRAFAPLALPRAAQLLRWCERRGCGDEISELLIDREDGVTMFPMSHRIAVHLGWGRWSEKLRLSARVVSAWRGRLDEVAVIDVSFRERVIVRRRQPRDVVRSPTVREQHA